MKIKVEFSNGLETLFNRQKEYNLEFEEKDKPSTLGDLVNYIKANLLRGKEDLFIQGTTVRPGIIVLINDTDWELMGQLEYEVEDNDSISFISTLHGG